MDIKNYGEQIKKAMEILPKGAFLTTHDGTKVNSMTIGWGSFGFEWGIPVFEAMVRESRFSKGALDSQGKFTVTFPYDSSMNEALSFCGKNSGRDHDKVSECGLVIADGKSVSAPVVVCHGLVIECTIVNRFTMAATDTDADILEKWYKNGDLHTIYFGKIESIYEI